MKQNKMFYMFLFMLIAGILFAAILMCKQEEQNWPLFIVYSLTALGTCGVTILSVFPYKHKDKLSARLYRRTSDGHVMLKVINKTDHTIRLGASNLPLPHDDNFLLWWKPGDELCLENAHPMWSNGIGLEIPPYDCVFFESLPDEFDGVPAKNVIMQVRTNTGYKCDVKNEL